MILGNLNELPYVAVMSARDTIVSCVNWIMNTGFWDDYKIWIDDCIWID